MMFKFKTLWIILEFAFWMFLIAWKYSGNFGEVPDSAILVPLLSFFMSSELEIWQIGTWNQGTIEIKGLAAGLMHSINAVLSDAIKNIIVLIPQIQQKY